MAFGIGINVILKIFYCPSHIALIKYLVVRGPYRFMWKTPINAVNILLLGQKKPAMKAGFFVLGNSH